MDVQGGESEGGLGSESDSEPTRTEYDSEEKLMSQELLQRDEAKRVGNGRERGGVSGRARGGDERESPRAPAASMTSRCGEGRWRCRAVSDATGCREPLSLSERFQKGAAFAASALAHGRAVRPAAIFSQSDGGSGGAAARGERRRAA